MNNRTRKIIAGTVIGGIAACGLVGTGAAVAEVKQGRWLYTWESQETPQGYFGRVFDSKGHVTNPNGARGDHVNEIMSEFMITRTGGNWVERCNSYGGRPVYQRVQGKAYAVCVNVDF